MAKISVTSIKMNKTQLQFWFKITIYYITLHESHIQCPTDIVLILNLNLVLTWLNLLMVVLFKALTNFLKLPKLPQRDAQLKRGKFKNSP